MSVYTLDYDPPAPVLAVVLAPWGEAPQLGPFLALLDTGADSTFVPQPWLEALEAPPIDTVSVRGMFSEPQNAVLYKIDLIVNNQRLPSVGVVGYAEEEMVLGRNVLNRLILLLNGPKQIVELLEKPPVLR